MKKPMELENKFQDKTMGLEVIKEHGFQDSDYESNSSMINRIKNFTFVRQEWVIDLLIISLILYFLVYINNVKTSPFVRREIRGGETSRWLTYKTE